MKFLKENIQAKIKEPFDKYFEIVSDQEMLDLSGADNVYDISALEASDYDNQHIVFIKAKDEYFDTLDNAELAYAEIVDTGDGQFISQRLGDRVFNIENDILNVIK